MSVWCLRFRRGGAGFGWQLGVGDLVGEGFVGEGTRRLRCLELIASGSCDCGRSGNLELEMTLSAEEA